MVRVTWILVTVITSVWLAGSARAETLKEQAKKATSAGLEAQNAGRYDDAIAFYRKAYDAVPHPEILFNLAQAYRLKGDAETALGLYERYLAIEPRGRVAADARKWMSVLEKLVTRKAEDTGKTDAAEPAKTEPADPAKADARRTDLASTDVRKAEDAGKIDSAPRPEPARTDTAGSNVATGGTGAAPPTSGPRDGRLPLSRRYALIVAGSGGVLMLSATMLGALARGKRDEAIELCGDDRMCDTSEDTARANDLLGASRSRGNAATLLFALGGVGIATGAVLWFTGGETSTRTAVTPVIAPSAVGVAWGGRF